MAVVERQLRDKALASLKQFKILAIIGPRQVGKSTLAAGLLGKDGLWLDLERPSDLRKLDDPETFLTQHSAKLICIDEVQQRPDLFPVLRVLSDAGARNGQFLILGSASPELLRQSSETLAGRIQYLELTPFLLEELCSQNQPAPACQVLPILWLKGGYPLSYLAGEGPSFAWRQAYIATFLERDLSLLGFNRSPTVMRRFWTMLAHSQGQVVNYSKLAGSLDTTAPTIKSFIAMMVDTFMVRVLMPWHRNIKKRLVKSPKVYVRDAGILHALLDIETRDQLQGHPVYGSSFEGFAIEQILASISTRWQASFYRSATGDELDLVLSLRTMTLAIEIKASKAPAFNHGNRNALKTVQPDHCYLLGLVDEPYTLDERVTVTNIPALIVAIRDWERR